GTGAFPPSKHSGNSGCRSSAFQRAATAAFPFSEPLRGSALSYLSEPLPFPHPTAGFFAEQ
ncbi:MAG: hypothetical protein WC076_08960, partial [Terrimicrobiaceae bacterium]